MKPFAVILLLGFIAILAERAYANRRNDNGEVYGFVLIITLLVCLSAGLHC